jgi:hypothetical protein
VLQSRQTGHLATTDRVAAPQQRHPGRGATASSPDLADHASPHHRPASPLRRPTYGDPAISGRLALSGVPGERPLKGRQTVCSGSCRAKRWRARSVDQRQASVSRDEEIRALLETALKKLGEHP